MSRFWVMVSLAATVFMPLAVGRPQGPSKEGARPAFDPSRSDPEAIALVDTVWAGLGGKNAYERISYIRFTEEWSEGALVRSRRTILFDRRKDRARLEMDTNRGKLLVLIDRRSGTGKAYENGRPILDEDQQGVVARARSFVDADLYWLLMPWHLKDPGVELHLAGEVERGERVLKRIEVRNGARDWLGWGPEFHLLIDEQRGEPVEWVWPRPSPDGLAVESIYTFEGWTEHVGVRFATLRKEVGGVFQLLLDPLEVPRAVGAAEFQAPNGS